MSKNQDEADFPLVYVHRFWL